MLNFEYIQLLWLLLLLPIIILIFIYAVNRKKQVAKLLSDAHLIKLLTASYNKRSYTTKFALMFFAMTCVLLSLANLRSKTGSQKITRNGIDVMIALDVSKSMYAKDIQPNRLERAKQILNTLIDKLSNDRIGIVIFAGKAYLQMPITADHTATKMYIAAASPETVPTQGTVLGDALKMCNAAFNNKEKKYKSVILISDGEDHDDGAKEIAAQMYENGITINTIAIGSAEGSAIIDELTGEQKKDKDENVVITKVNEKILSDIASEGKGLYQLYSNTNDVVSKLYNELSTMDKRKVEDNSLNNHKSLFQYLLGFAILLLVIEVLVSEVKSKKINAPKLYMLLVLFLFIHTSSFAQAENENIKIGNEAYKKSNFEEAILFYKKDADKNNNIATYNYGNALYKANKKDEAIIAFDKASSESKNLIQKSNAFYNKAVVLQNNKMTQECIEAYKKALLYNANNEDARHNLQIALKQQKQEEQQKKENKKNKENKNNSKNDQNKKEPQPQPKQSNISKADAEQKLDALQQKEKELQDKLHKANSANPKKQEKDW